MTRTTETHPFAALDDAVGAVAELSAGRDEDPSLLPELVGILRRARFGALRVPTEHGGFGVSVAELISRVVEIAEHHANLAHVFRTHFAFVESRIRSTRQDERERWLGAAGSGTLFANLASEQGPRREPPLPPFRTRLHPVDGGLALTGEKFYSTGSPYVDELSVLTWSEPDEAVVNVVVPRRDDRVEVVGDWDGFGQRLTGSGTTRFHAVPVTDDRILRIDGQSGDGYQYFALGHIYNLAIQVGILRATLRDAVGLLRSRVRTFRNSATSSPLTDPQLLSALGGIVGAVRAGERTLSAAAAVMDEAMVRLLSGSPDRDLELEFSIRIAQAKLLIDDIGPRAASEIFELGGASATRSALNLDRHWRNSRTISTHNPAAAKALAIGRHRIDPVEPYPDIWGF